MSAKSDKKSDKEESVLRGALIDSIIAFVIIPLLGLGTGLALSMMLAPNSLVLFSMISMMIGMIGLGVLLLWLRNPLARAFLTLRGRRFYAFFIRPDRTIDIVRPKWVNKKQGLVKIGKDYYVVRPTDIFNGPNHTSWTIIFAGEAIKNGVGLLIYPSDITPLQYPPNAIVKIGGKEYALYLNPTPTEVDALRKHVDEHGGKLFILGAAIPMSELASTEDISELIERESEEKARQISIIEQKRREELLKTILVLGVAFPCIATGLVILYKAVTGG